MMGVCEKIDIMAQCMLMYTCAGVSIVVPEGALEEGVSQEIYFKVCSGNSILPPLDEDKGQMCMCV